MTDMTKDVLVVGAGPVGLTRALKELTGHTPAEIATTTAPIIVEHRS